MNNRSIKTEASVQKDVSCGKTNDSGQMVRNILVIDDDEILSRFLSRFLSSQGFAVQCVHDGTSALESVSSETDLLILDLMLPGLDGVAVLSRLRPTFPKLPILVLTGAQRSQSVARVLDNGADDCLNKPFSCVELLARTRALLRRNTAVVPRSTQCEGLALYRDELRVLRDGVRLDLTPREYNLLEYLMRTPGVPVSRSALLKDLWGEGTDCGSNIVDVYMKYLRDKIDLPGMPKLIHTVRGVGYVVSQT